MPVTFGILPVITRRYSRGLRTAMTSQLRIARLMTRAFALVAAFDRAYIDNEVTFHQTVLDALDKTLIPNAQNAGLEALLEQVRPNISAATDARTLSSRIDVNTYHCVAVPSGTPLLRTITPQCPDPVCVGPPPPIPAPE